MNIIWKVIINVDLAEDDGNEEETALMEMSDLKCLQTIRTRHSLLNIFKNC